LKIVERFRSPATLCDFGCGAGELLRIAEGRGWDVTGVEPGATRNSLTAQGFQVVSDIQEMPPVDVVVMVHALEHCPDPSNVLLDLRKKIKHGGLIYIEVPNADSLRARLANSFLKPLWTFAAERYLAFPIHLFYFNPHSLSRLLKNQRYQILELGTMGMGVEELFAPKANGNASLASKSSTASARPRFQFAKNIIKSGFYRSHLGENLYVVATVS
jgi:2-polyprenyl-3-methyl-5-hydroxy-6-metoxy-1,4-benzoquinol methylase